MARVTAPTRHAEPTSPPPPPRDLADKPPHPPPPPPAAHPPTHNPHPHTKAQPTPEEQLKLVLDKVEALKVGELA